MPDRAGHNILNLLLKGPAEGESYRCQLRNKKR